MSDLPVQVPRPVPIVSLGSAWNGIGQWCGGVNRCSRGDCRYFRRRLRSSSDLCCHEDGAGIARDGMVLCVPFYKELTRRYGYGSTP